MAYKIAVVGSRIFNDYMYMQNVLDMEILELEPWKGQVELISGGAEGADTLAEVYAKNTDLIITVYPARWDDLDAPGAVIKENHHGKYNALAGYARNQIIAEECDMVIGFWDGISKGTADVLRRARKLGKPVKVYGF